MSVANLNTNGTLRCKNLILDGQTLVPSAGGTTLQVGTGAPQSGAITLAGSVTQAGSTFTFSGAGGGTTVPTLWSNTAAYAVGAVVSVGSLATPTGTFICITAVPAGAPTNPAPSATPADWTPVAPLAGGTGVSSVGGGTVVAPATGAITLVGAGGITVSGAGGAGGSITLTGSGAGVAQLTGGGATPTPAVGNVAFTSTVANGASTALTWTSTATGMELGGTIGGASAGVASLAGGGATPTLATGAVLFTSTVASGASTALTWTSTATGMELGGTIASSAQSVPYIIQAGQKAWTATGTTDAITLTALPAGTYIIMLSWGMATAPPALLTAPPPTAGATTVAVVASGSVPATSVYQWSVIRLTLT